MHAATTFKASTGQKVSFAGVLGAVGFWGLILVAGAAAQEKVAAPPPRPTPLPAAADPNAVRDPNAVVSKAGPYIGQINTNDVMVRSGAGTNFYHCGKLYTGDTVRVVKTDAEGWACIVPPPGYFSWVALQYLSINIEDPTLAMVTGNGVGIYAGSDYVRPIQSTSKQVMLNRGDKVKLLGEESDDYYKIVPPDGTYLYVHSKFIQPVGSVPAVGVGPRPGPDVNVPVNVTLEQQKLKEFYELRKQMDAELKKPVEEQDYTKLADAMGAIAKTKEAGKAARYAEYVLPQLERFQLALTVMREVQQQTKALEQAQGNIEKDRAAKIAQVEQMGRFAVIGQLKPFLTYGPGFYRVLDSTGRTVCYAVPDRSVASTDFSKFVDKKVGVVGKIEPRPGLGGAAVTFTEIAEVK